MVVMKTITDYMRARHYILHELKSHDNLEEPIKSEREFAGMIGVSRIVVRYALRGLISEGIIISGKTRGNFISPGHFQSITTKKRELYNVMVLFGGGKQLGLDGFYSSILEGICAVYKHIPVSLQSVSLNGRIEEFYNEIMMYFPDGIIWVRPEGKMTPVIAALRESVPVCCLGDKPGGDIFAVTADYLQAGRIVGKWIIDNGYRYPAFAGYNTISPIRREIYHGWAGFLVEQGVKHDNIETISSQEKVTARVASLLDSGVDCIFSLASDFIVIDLALRALRRRCAVIVDENYFGDYGAVNPISAMVELFPPEIATTAAAEMFRVLEKSGELPGEIVISPRIIKTPRTKNIWLKYLYGCNEVIKD